MFIYVVMGFIISVVVGKIFLKVVTRKNIVQPILSDAPEIHQKKAGTPTMGGISFLIPFILMCFVLLLFRREEYNGYIIIGFLVIALGFGYIGYRDDFQKVLHKKNEKGLSAKSKLVLQFLMSFIVIWIMILVNSGTTISILNVTFELGILYIIIAPFMIVGFSNASNFTDGLDGLLVTLSIIIFSSLLFIANLNGQSTMIVIISFLIGSLLGFLYYNKYPARMFMGDTGSLVIGSIIAFSIILLKVEILGLFMSSILIFEVLSVIIQVSYFKYTKRKYGEGRRIFRMTPIHHHFEKGGMSERKVVLLFASVQLIICIIAILIYIG
ncbi:MAG: phospho-N-acetylmuramoyl-pentapeptide-transferase [Mycoplasmatales bacterium]